MEKSYHKNQEICTVQLFQCWVALRGNFLNFEALGKSKQNISTQIYNKLLRMIEFLFAVEGIDHTMY